VPTIVVCTKEHARLAEPADLIGSPGPCIGCGAPTVLATLPLPQGPSRVQMPPGYKIFHRLEGATMAAVYLAWCRARNTLVALKVGLAGSDGQAADHIRLRREGARLAALCHPNIARLIEAGERAGLPFFSTEWLPGGTLADRLGQGPLSPRVAVACLERVSRAIHYSHCQALFHNDLRPLNVVFSRAGEPKLIDFGLSRKLPRPGGTLRSGLAAGDPRYTAPEQAEKGIAPVGPAAEVYALGALLYHVLAGRPPFHGIGLHERGRSRVAVPRLEAVRPDLPKALNAICLRCLQREPEQRYPTAEALAGELSCVLSDSSFGE
jgi:serine/threonine-protein kinase